MKVQRLLPPITDHDTFARHCLRFVPKVPGCYVLTTFSGDILYVGLSQDLRRRLGQHLEDPRKTSSCALGRAILMHWRKTSELEGTERAWLNQHEVEDGGLPPLNSVHSPISW